MVQFSDFDLRMQLFKIVLETDRTLELGKHKSRLDVELSLVSATLLRNAMMNYHTSRNQL